MKEALLVFGLVTLATLGVNALGALPALSEYVHLAVGVLFLFTALHMAGRSAGGLRAYGIELGGLLEAPAGETLLQTLKTALPLGLRETTFALLLCALIFPPFIAGFYFWHAPAGPFSLGLPDAFGGYLMAQVLVVALPEEALFRGYLQTQLRAGASRRVLGADIWPGALVGQAFLFALIHFAVDLNPVRLAVFFPGLAFGWIRARRGGIGAAALFHALCNLLSDVLVSGWL